MEAVYKFLFVSLAICSLVVEEALAEKHEVGGSQGWDESTDISSRASGQTFKVGDQLGNGLNLNLVHYRRGKRVQVHSRAAQLVELAGESAYKSCDVSTALDSMNGGNDVVKLSKPGTGYFGCGTPGYCGQGMKVKITTVAADGSPATPSASSSFSSSSSAASAVQYFATLVLVASLLGLHMLFFV